MEIYVDPLPCGKISRAVSIGTSWQIDVVTFRGQRDFEVQRDFEEIRYLIEFMLTFIMDLFMIRSVKEF